MNRTELVSAIAEKTGMTKKDSDKALQGIIDSITDELAGGGRVQLVGFGTFDVAERAAREGRNPQTGEAMQISASKAARFKVGKALKDAVNG